MSLLDGPDVVELFPDEVRTDRDGNVVRRPASAAVPVRGRWQYETVEESSADGQSVLSLASFRCRAFPAGFAGRLVFDGREWDVVGEPTWHGRGTFVSHMVVRLRARAPRAVA